MTFKSTISETNNLIIKPHLLFKAAFIAALFFISACGTNQITYYSFNGQTMGTFYNITFEGSNPQDLKKEVDELLVSVNNSLSTYIATSTISKINSNESTEGDMRFNEVFNLAKEIYKNTDGSFDPTVGPLVNAWGFGFKSGDGIDSNTIDSLMQFVGFDNVNLEGNSISKKYNETIIDFSAIAKGYGVDEVAKLLNQKAIKNYMIEIGGEVVVKGNNKDEQPWRLGINEPNEGSNKVFAIAMMSEGGLATSGNYRNFREIDGQRYVHTISPKTGYGVMSKLLSASVVAKDCATADAYATAFMVMGVEEAIKYSEKIIGVDIYLIYLNDKNQLATYSSQALKEKIKVAVN